MKLLPFILAISLLGHAAVANDCPAESNLLASCKNASKSNISRTLVDTVTVCISDADEYSLVVTALDAEPITVTAERRYVAGPMWVYSTDESDFIFNAHVSRVGPNAGAGHFQVTDKKSNEVFFETALECTK